MSMKKTIDIDQKLYDAYIYVNGLRVYRVSGNGVFVEAYMDQPGISPKVFWRDYAFSGEADAWFPQLDPDSIHFSVSPGQYDVGSGIRAYGKLSSASDTVIKKIKDHMQTCRAVNRKVNTLSKKISEMQKEIRTLNETVDRLDIQI